MTIGLVITVAKRVPVILDEWRRHLWIAEARVTIGIWRRSLRNVTLCRLEAVMVTLLRDLRIPRGWGWGRIVGRGLWMRTSRKRKGEQQCCHREQFLHEGSSFIEIWPRGHGFL
jgi:hypothetical protein